MKISSKLFIVISSVLVMLSCSGGNFTSEKVSNRVKDFEAFALGEKHAEEIISLGNNESAVQESLLEIHARATNFREKISAQSAADYERGFVSYIKENSDSLSAILF